MSKLVVIQLGGGNLQHGFPLVTAQLWEQPSALPEQFVGALPAAPQLQMLSQSWQALYRALCLRAPAANANDSAALRSLAADELDDDDDTFEIEEGGIQYVSSYEFDELCQTLSTQFNQWLCSTEFAAIDRPLRSRLSSQDNIRIILTTQNDPIRRLPWQRWDILKDFSNAEIALSLPQYHRQQRSLTQPRTTPRILAILGNAEGIDLTYEQQQLSELPNTDVEFLIQPSREEFSQALWNKTGWDLLFFAGHSSSEGSQIGRLYLTDNANTNSAEQSNPPKNKQAKNSLTIDELSEALSAALENGLQLAIFNSCDGLGLANQLAHLNIPQVIVMREPVPNRVAQAFFQSFLNAYVQDALPLYAAIKRSRRQLQGLEDNFPGASWLPVLCQNPAEVPLTWAELCHVPSEASSTAKDVLPSNRENSDRQILLNKIRNAWIKGVLQKSLPSQILVSPTLVERPDLLQTPAAPAIAQLSSADYPLPPGAQVIDYFDQLGAGRSLLLLGKPGAGKTITLLDLAQTLLNRAEQDVRSPLPVILNLSTWQSGKSQSGKSQSGKSKRKANNSIYLWLQQALYSYYQVPTAKTERWLRSAQISLLLDGLDEVTSDRRATCIQAINQFHQDYEQVEIVVCSRQNAYQETGELLTLQAALMLQPLSAEQIQDYCTALGDFGKPLQQLLKGDRQLNQLAASPLLLNIIAAAADEMSTSTSLITTNAKHNSETKLTQPLDDCRHRLFNAYIDRMLGRRTAHRTASPAATISGLRYLAQQLQRSGQSVFQIEDIQPTWLDNPTQKRAYPIILGITLATILSIVPTLVSLWLGNIWTALSILVCWGLLGGSISGFIGGWLGGLTGGLIGGSVSAVLLWILIPRFIIGMITTPLLAIFMAFIMAACRSQIVPVQSFRWSWVKAVQWLLLGVGVGAIISIPVVLRGNVEWRVLLPAVGVIFILLGGFTPKAQMDKLNTRANEGIWRTGRNSLHLGLLATLIYSVISTVIFGLNTSGGWDSFRESLPFGAIAGLIMGTFIGLVGARGSGVVCIQHLVLRVMLWQQNRIPWNYARFLDDCANRVLMQKVGGSYIFLHRLFQEHFADWRPSK
ncbi:MAG: CHAT domain-containing protein [Phormidesmis sp.]